MTRLFTLVERLRGVESLAELPEKMTHGSIPPAERLALGITPDLVRLSVGVEDVGDCGTSIIVGHQWMEQRHHQRGLWRFRVKLEQRVSARSFIHDIRPCLIQYVLSNFPIVYTPYLYSSRMHGSLVSIVVFIIL
ncbi:hypothetical protein M422DRAFT_36324 [Sphaerobolus stellatus SS14]|uniref:cystathionine gamma-lyase n=1 Tax=Sphaerobolus stellatus (strain SS14) TaxID=990650 RepID=A0A0C9TMG1_SPHS4|nr:hypothetical protein M422DRAFT_36324 [Sphaerobolus stellatus SS14]